MLKAINERDGETRRAQARGELGRDQVRRQRAARLPRVRASSFDEALRLAAYGAA
jgi:hypothetical protein